MVAKKPDVVDERRSASSGTSSAAALADSIRELIRDQSLAAGDRIGAERELAERYGVTRWIVRRALDQLESSGAILRTNGRSGGVFVGQKKVVRDLETLRGLPEYMHAQGLEASTTVLGTRLVQADDDLSRRLAVGDGAWLFQVERLRLAGGLPLSVESVHLRADLFPGLLDRSLGSLYELLDTEYGIERGDAQETISAVAAGKTHATMLRVSVGTALLAVDRVACLADGRPFETGKEFYRSDRVEITVHTHGDSSAQRLLITPNLL